MKISFVFVLILPCIAATEILHGKYEHDSVSASRKLSGGKGGQGGGKGGKGGTTGPDCTDLAFQTLCLACVPPRRQLTGKSGGKGGKGGTVAPLDCSTILADCTICFGV